jgi:hypothetical protein
MLLKSHLLHQVQDIQSMLVLVFFLIIIGGITVPSTYTDSGFDQTYIDMVIFIVIENKK